MIDPEDTTPDPDSSGAAAGVGDLDAAGVFAAVRERRAVADRAEADLLTLVVALVDLHPAAVDLWDGEVAPGRAGEGRPRVAEQAVEELGAHLGISYVSALTLVSETLELRHRLPRLWELVQAGRLQAWRARRVAAHTSELSTAGAEFVDRHAAVAGRHNRLPGSITGLVHEAWLQTDPDHAQGLEEAALARRGVRFETTESTATTTLVATLDTLDAIDLDNTLRDLATSMRRLGDTDPLDVRRAHALGTLAHPQRALDLVAADPAAAGDWGPARSRAGATVYLHVTTADLESPARGGGRVERIGAASLELLSGWLQRIDEVTVRPVLDVHRLDSVTVHDPPGWMRETVLLRDGHCVFPGCGIDARGCDLDHIEPYAPPEDGGPPGQTSVENLAALCRRHHRLKTFTAWSYRRLPSEAGLPARYRWTDPDGHTHLAFATPRS